MKRLAMTLSVLAAVCAVSTPAMADEAMLKMMNDKGCATCHKVDGKKTGPSYKEVAAKYSASDVDIFPLLSGPGTAYMARVT